MTSLVIYRQWRTCNPSSEDWDNMLYLEELYLNLRGGRVEKHLRKNTLSTIDRDSSLDLAVISNLICCESHALDHAATKAESVIDVWKSKDTIATFDSGGLYAANSAMTTV
uniref:Uncharacterized protein n=1 Tax=Timema tahoe TaxID=61484 RepID=A0A7R9I9D8_9NEOP|nr:unnamed protein product [Timema tahoe]